jgi:predicted transcriptional regulator
MRPIQIADNIVPLAQEHQRFLAAVQEGLEDIDAGRWVADEDLEAELAVELGWE